MADHLAEPIASAATVATVNASKIGTVSGVVVATTASYFGDYGIAIAGLCFTILFGILGLLVSWHFKSKEHKLKEAEAVRDAERHEMAKAEHRATIDRLASSR